MQTFWCLEGEHYFEEHEHSNKRKYRKAICRDCTKRIMEKFFTSSDGVRISSIYQNIVDAGAQKRRWWKRRKKDGKESSKEKPEAPNAQGKAGRRSQPEQSAASTAGRQTKGVPKKDGTAWASSARPEGRLPNASEERGSAGRAAVPESTGAAVASDPAWEDGRALCKVRS